ncbi:MAG: ATP-binding protein [Propionibacteriaceae bacterium]|nr:ATP-binding protein [Propionibacteriaceae bacterium]
MLAELPVVVLEGAKGVGKTATALQRAGSVYSLDRRTMREMAWADPSVVLEGSPPVFIDEWQLVPDVWNEVRHAVDADMSAGRFILAGSATPKKGTRVHSGAGRMVRLAMRPMSLPERGIEKPAISMSHLMDGGRDVAGQTSVKLSDYVDEILSSGFPGIRAVKPAARQRLVESYISQVAEHDIDELGVEVRRPDTLLHWLAAYGAATSTTASYSSLLAAATPGEASKPAKETGMAYRDLLARLWLLDPLPAWVPGFAHLKRLGQAPKHHLVDPALAAALVGATRETLLHGEGPTISSDGTFLGALFESLAAQTVRVLAGAAGAKVSHLRTQGGEREIDMIVERKDGKVLAVEVKLATVVRPADVKSLNWLEEQLPDTVVGKLILNTGQLAYRRPDGVAVVPLAMLGP